MQLLVIVIVLGLLYYCVTLLPLPAPFKQIALVIVVVLCIFWLLGYSGLAPWGWHGVHWRR